MGLILKPTRVNVFIELSIHSHTDTLTTHHTCLMINNATPHTIFENGQITSVCSALSVKSKELLSESQIVSQFSSMPAKSNQTMFSANTAIQNY